MDSREIIETYFRTFRERDKEALRSILTPDFRHVSPFGEWNHRDEMIEAIWSEVGRSWAARLEIFGEPPGLMVRYEQEGVPDAAGSSTRMAEFVRLEGDRIAEIEVYMGRRQFSGGSDGSRNRRPARRAQ